MFILPDDNKGKPRCTDGVELVSLSCNRVSISAGSVGWCRCKSRLERSDTSSMRPMMWFSFNAVNSWPIHIYAIQKTNEWDMHRFSKVIKFSIMTTQCNIHSVRLDTPPHPKQRLRVIFHVQNWNGYSVIGMRYSLQSKHLVCGRRPVLC